MKTEVNPKDTTRAEAFEMWMTSPMPMVTLTKTFDVSRLLKASKKFGVKFNALLCWCIGKAATQIEEFYLLPDKDKLYKYDSIAINVIVNNSKGVVCTSKRCNILGKRDIAGIDSSFAIIDNHIYCNGIETI